MDKKAKYNKYKRVEDFLARIFPPGTLDEIAQDNKADQCNSNNTRAGPVRSAGYKGTGDKANLNDHSKQGDPNYKG